MVRNVLQYLEASAGKYPDKIALKDENEQLTYSEYVANAKAIATYLATHEAKDTRNKPIAVIIDRNTLDIELIGHSSLLSFQPKSLPNIEWI